MSSLLKKVFTDWKKIICMTVQTQTKKNLIKKLLGTSIVSIISRYLNPSHKPALTASVGANSSSVVCVSNDEIARSGKREAAASELTESL